MSSSFTLAPGRLEAAGRSRGGQHAAQSRPPTPQRQSVLPGSPPDLQLSGVTLVRRVTQRSVPCKLQEKRSSQKKIGPEKAALKSPARISVFRCRRLPAPPGAEWRNTRRRVARPP